MVRTIIKPICNVYNIPNDKSILETQFLFGEKVKIIKEKRNWYQCKNLNDEYIGWLKKNNVGFIPEPNYMVNNLSTLVFTEPNLKSSPFLKLPFNSKVFINTYDKKWSEISLGKNVKKGFIFNKHISKITDYSHNIVKTINSFKNTPYLWGGKSYQGIDCSGLIQLILQSKGIKFPRNTNEQIKYFDSVIIKSSSLNKNNLIFWENHVALSVSKNFVIHSSAHDLKVVKEKLSTIEKRFERKNLKILSISNILN